MSDLRRSIVFAVVAAFILLTGAGLIIRVVRGPELGWGSREPKIPTYPHAKNEKYLKNESLGWQSLTFDIVDNYPSNRVFDYYRNLLESQGYKPIEKAGVEEYTWQSTDVTKEGRRLVMSGYWIDPDGLRVFQMDISTYERYNRDSETDRLINTDIEPGLKVEIVLSRKVILPTGEKKETEAN